jgi:peptide/nickel transport system substrate-binding protein
MKRLTKYFLIGAILALVGVLVVVPVTAQDNNPRGGILIEGNFGGDPATFNPLLASDTASARVSAFMFPAFAAVDPATATFVKDGQGLGAMVTDWTISDDGLVYTFTLRDDWNWSDGTPITSADVLYTWNAINSGVVETQSVYILDSISDVTAPDAHTVVVTFKTADCTALNYAGSLAPLPSHILPQDFSQLNDSDFNFNPTVTAGIFSFGEFRPSEQVSLIADQNYPDATRGFVSPDGWIYKNVPDQTVLTEQFLAGETNLIDNAPVSRRSDLRAAGDAGDVQVYSYPGNAWDYVGLNLADPNNPQNAFDADGNPIDQGHHPIFSDVRVRQALAQAIDVDSIVQGAVFGEGSRMTSFIIPASWAYDNDLPPIAFDPDKAAQLLTDAGWVDDDNNPDTPRIAMGAMYAQDGDPLEFTLYTNNGNSRRTAIGTIVQDQLKQIGVQVDFQTIDFNTLLDIMNSQTFDAFILGWRNGYPDDPDVTQILTPVSDVVGSGSDNTSYNNPEFNDLNAQAKALPGCDPAERSKLYAQMQQIFQQDLPYIPLYAINGMYASRSTVQGFGPYPSQLYWNVDTWAVNNP